MIIKTAEDLKQVHWKPVYDWTGLIIENYVYVKERNILLFIDNLTRDIARKTGLKFQDVKTVIESENTEFFSYLEEHRPFNYPLDRGVTCNLKRLLLVPDMNQMEENSAQVVLEMFGALSDIEKLKVLQELEKLKVQIVYK